jgi:hypothetical protein
MSCFCRASKDDPVGMEYKDQQEDREIQESRALPDHREDEGNR